VAALGVWYGRTVRRMGRWSHTLWFLLALLSMWIALDWPVGALGAGYLASFHAISYVLLALIAPPCLILSVPESVVRPALARPYWGPVLRYAGRWWLGLSVFDGVVLLTHVPAVVDSLMVSQVGALVIDLSWVVGGVLLWWPVMAPAPEVATLNRPMKLAYLFVSTLAPIIPSAFLTFAPYPLYATYELAPRIFSRLTAQQDQQVAGLIMKIIGDLPVWAGFGVIFFRWAREGELHPPPSYPGVVTRATGNS